MQSGLSQLPAAAKPAPNTTPFRAIQWGKICNRPPPVVTAVLLERTSLNQLTYTRGQGRGILQD
jgi:hypothetical protein